MDNNIQLVIQALNTAVAGCQTDLLRYEDLLGIEEPCSDSTELVEVKQQGMRSLCSSNQVCTGVY